MRFLGIVSPPFGCSFSHSRVHVWRGCEASSPSSSGCLVGSSCHPTTSLSRILLPFHLFLFIGRQMDRTTRGSEPVLPFDRIPSSPSRSGVLDLWMGNRRRFGWDKGGGERPWPRPGDPRSVPLDTRVTRGVKGWIETDPYPVGHHPIHPPHATTLPRRRGRRKGRGKRPCVPKGKDREGRNERGVRSERRKPKAEPRVGRVGHEEERPWRP